MQDTRPLRWLSNDDLKFNSVVLPYKDEGLVAVVIVPQTDFGLPAVLDKINSTHLAAILTKAELQKVMIVLPKFCLDHSINVLDAIPRIQIADTDKADFSLMTKNRTKLSRVLQKSRIEVDEKGTQASQANLTESVPASTSNGGKLKQLIADQPFLFLIVHPKGLVLFATAVWNPTAIPTSVSN